MHFPDARIAANALYSQRAATGADGFQRKAHRKLRAKTGAVLCLGEPGGAGLRVLLVAHFPGVVDDSRLYANIAQNWLQHGVYGITNSGVVVPTLSRLPGYPAFLAAIFALFGMGQFPRGPAGAGAVRSGNLFSDCRSGAAACSPSGPRRPHFCWRRSVPFWPIMQLRLSPRLWRFSSPSSRWIWLSAVLQSAMTETRAPLPSAAQMLSGSAADSRSGQRFCCGRTAEFLLAAIGGYLLWLLLAACLRSESQADSRTIFWAGVLLVAGGDIVPLIPWTLRNLHTFHRFEPLAPRYANDAEDIVMTGFNRWSKTWMADYVSVQEIYWNVPGDAIDVTRLPQPGLRFAGNSASKPANSSPTTTSDQDMTPELDARFAALAAGEDSRCTSALLHLASRAADCRYVAASANRVVARRTRAGGSSTTMAAGSRSASCSA